MIFDLIKKNRTLRELIAGIALIAIICEILLLIFTKNRIYNSIGLIIGTLTSLICAVHMAWGIENAVMLDEKSSIAISRKYTIIRYLLMCAVLVAIGVTDIGSPVTLIFGFLSLKLLTRSKGHLEKFIKETKDEAVKIYKVLETGDIEASRKQLSYIVGRDTTQLDEGEIVRATVETVAENTSDGIIAPLILLALGGSLAGFFYKCINTMDSMIGYKNPRYIDFGRCAAKTDDFVNFIPARISAWLMIFSCCFLGKDFSTDNAKKIYLRDRLKHESPNSAHMESTCAGALGIQLAGPAVYEGKVEHKEFLGDQVREIELEDIKRANKLSYATSFICVLSCSAIMGLIYFAIKYYNGIKQCTVAIFIQ